MSTCNCAKSLAISSMTMRTLLRGNCLQMNTANLNTVVQILVEKSVCLRFHVVEIEHVIDRDGIVSLANQVGLRILEGACHFNLVADPQKQGTRIGRQTAHQVLAKSRQVQGIFGNDRSHTSPAFGGGNRYTINVGVLDTRKCADSLRNLRGGDVLTFPAEGITDAIDKIEISLLVLPHQIAGAHPHVSRLKDLSKDLSFRSLLVGISLESAADVRGVIYNLAQCFAGFIRTAASAKP